jgi:hypothetical protein
MKKILATLTAAIAIAAVAAGPASAKPGQYTRFSESTAANGAHRFALARMGAAGTSVFDPGLKVTTDCRMGRYSGSHSAALWLCGVDTYAGIHDEHVGHAVVGVTRRNGQYELRTYKLVKA